MDNWIKVDGYEGVPMGNWLVRIESGKNSFYVEVISRNRGISVIGDHFAFEDNRVISYHIIPGD